MANSGGKFNRPIKMAQDFLDANLGDDLAQIIENGHASEVLKAIDNAIKGNYAEAATSFLISSATASTQKGKEYCENFAKVALDAHSAYENALANAASEVKAKERAEALWNICAKELAIYVQFLGVQFSERKKYSQAIEYYDKAIKIDPACAIAYFSRGSNKVDLNLFDDGISDIRTAEKLYLEQNDIENYQIVSLTLNKLLNLDKYNDESVENQNIQEHPEDSIYNILGDTQEMLHNAARLTHFSMEVLKKNPKIDRQECKALAAEHLYEDFKNKYNYQAKKYSELDLQFIKVIYFHGGLYFQESHDRKKSQKKFLMGLVIGLIIGVFISYLLKI